MYLMHTHIYSAVDISNHLHSKKKIVIYLFMSDFFGVQICFTILQWLTLLKSWLGKHFIQYVTMYKYWYKYLQTSLCTSGVPVMQKLKTPI